MKKTLGTVVPQGFGDQQLDGCFWFLLVQEELGVAIREEAGSQGAEPGVDTTERWACLGLHRALPESGRIQVPPWGTVGMEELLLWQEGPPSLE